MEGQILGAQGTYSCVTGIEKALQHKLQHRLKSDTQGWRLSQCYSSADQDMFCVNSRVNWFSIKLQNVIIKRIHFIKMTNVVGGLQSVGVVIRCIFCLQVGGPRTGGKAYERQFVRLF